MSSMDDRTLVGDDAMVASSVLAACDSFDRVDYSTQIVIRILVFGGGKIEPSTKHRIERSVRE